MLPGRGGGGAIGSVGNKGGGGQLKQPSDILYSPLLLLSLYALPKLVQPIPEGGGQRPS